MDATIKQIQITGGAEKVKGRRKGMSRKRKGEEGPPIISKQAGGGSCSSGYTAPLQVPGTAAPLSQAFQMLTPPGQNPQDLTKLAVSAMPNRGLDGNLVGGSRVELKKAPPSKKVHLHSKKTHPTKHHVTHKKKTRKIVLGLVSLQKRQTRAKKISQKMKEMPLDKLKQQLVEQGLIKITSKAPESVLRQIAADAQIVGGNGL
jgi:hypothetical protein